MAGGRKPVSTDYFTALHFTADGGREDVVAYLMEKGADVNADGGGMWTPLHRAANAGHLPVVRRLVEAGAKVDVKTRARPQMAAPGWDGKGKPPLWKAALAMTPLDLAKDRKHADVVKYLGPVGK